MPNRSDYIRDYKVVREELSQLKTCQMTFFSLSITGAVLIFSFAGKLSSQHISAVFLAPLFIIIPMGIVFFDKSATISRAVGFIRVLENIIQGNFHSSKYIGFENSLGLWRSHQFSNIRNFLKSNYDLLKTDRIKLIRNFGTFLFNFVKMSLLFNPMRYWMIVFYTYCGLSIACNLLAVYYYEVQQEVFILITQIYNIPKILSLVGFNMQTIFLLSFGITGLFLLYIFYFTWHLTYGHFSYDYNQKIWETLLK